MPLYEYACRQCEHTFETLVNPGDVAVCPECDSEKLDRLLSVPGVPKVQNGNLSQSCDPNAPPCSPHCCRL